MQLLSLQSKYIEFSPVPQVAVLLELCDGGDLEHKLRAIAAEEEAAARRGSAWTPQPTIGLRLRWALQARRRLWCTH